MLRRLYHRVRRLLEISDVDRAAGNGWAGDDDLTFEAGPDAVAASELASGDRRATVGSLFPAALAPDLQG